LSSSQTLPVVQCPSPDCLHLGYTSSLIATRCTRCGTFLLRWPGWLDSGPSRAAAFAVVLVGAFAAAESAVVGPSALPVFLYVFGLLTGGAAIALRNHERRLGRVLASSAVAFVLVGLHHYVLLPRVTDEAFFGILGPAAFALLYLVFTGAVLLEDAKLGDRVRQLARRRLPSSATDFLISSASGQPQTPAVSPLVGATDATALYLGIGGTVAVIAEALAWLDDRYGAPGLAREVRAAVPYVVLLLGVGVLLSAAWHALNAPSGSRAPFRRRAAVLLRGPKTGLPSGQPAATRAAFGLRLGRVVERTVVLIAASLVAALNALSKAVTYVANLVMHFWWVVEVAARAFLGRLGEIGVRALAEGWRSILHVWRAIGAVALLTTLIAFVASLLSDALRAYALAAGAGLSDVLIEGGLVLGLGVAMVAYLSELPFFDGIPDFVNVLIDALPWALFGFVIVDGALLLLDPPHFQPGVAFGVASAILVVGLVVVLIRQFILRPQSPQATQIGADPSTAADPPGVGVVPQQMVPLLGTTVLMVIVSLLLLQAQGGLFWPTRIKAPAIPIELPRVTLPEIHIPPLTFPQLPFFGGGAATPAPTGQASGPTPSMGPLDVVVADLEALGMTCGEVRYGENDGLSGAPMVAWTQCKSSDGRFQEWLNLYQDAAGLDGGFAARRSTWGDSGSCDKAPGSMLGTWHHNGPSLGSFACQNGTDQVSILWADQARLLLRQLVGPPGSYVDLHTFWSNLPA